MSSSRHLIMHTIFETDGPLAILTFNRPEARNALTGDRRVATPESTFGIPIARTLGNCLSAASHSRLVDVMGPGAVKDLLFTGRLVPAAEAHALGLVNRLVPAADIEHAVHAL